MVPISDLSHLANPLVSSEQLETSASQLDGISKDLEDSVRFQTARLMQAAGVLLRLPQELIAQSIVILYRFWAGPEGGSLLDHDSKVNNTIYVEFEIYLSLLISLQNVAAAAMYLTAKPSGTPLSPRQTLIVFEYLNRLGPDYLEAANVNAGVETEWSLSVGKYETARSKLFSIESHILRVLGFETHVALPYTLCINYLQTLDAFNSDDGPLVAKRSFAYLNTALLSPQLLYLTHQPAALATAAIYLAAREVEIKLPECSWWEVFDVDREQLGFLVVAMKSVEGFAIEEQRAWKDSRVPMTVEELRVEMEHRDSIEDQN